MLSPRHISDGKDLVLQQLSHPLFFVDNPTARDSLIARNHEAANALLAYYRGVGSPGIVANPEILAPRLDALIDAAKHYPWFRTREARPLTDQALARLAEVQDVLNNTIGDPRAWARLVDLMDTDLSNYENNVKQTFIDLRDAPFKVERTRFLGAGLKNCVDGSLVTGVDTTNLISPLFWAAQELRLGVLGQCYDARWDEQSLERPLIRVPVHPPVAMEVPGPDYRKWIFRVRVYFNHSPEADDLHLSDTASVRQLAWRSEASDPMHMLECIKNPNGCRSDPNRSIPQRDLLAGSTNNRDQTAFLNQITWAEQMVSARLKKVVVEQSRVWNSTKMARESAEKTSALVDWPTVQTPRLSESLNRYSEKFLLAKNLLLIGAYHENPMSTCIQALDEFSPVKVMEATTSEILSEQRILGDFKPRFTAALGKCTAHRLKPELQQIQAQLERLHEVQSRSK